MNEDGFRSQNPESPGGVSNLPKIVPLADIYENEEEILLYVSLPGVVKDDLLINMDNGVLTLSGIRKIARKGTSDPDEIKDLEYHRSFSVPQIIDTAGIQADLVDGILVLRLPKSAAEQPRIIEINPE